MRRKIPAFVLIAWALLFLFVTVGWSTSNSHHVDWVIDADTIVADGLTIRVSNIDACELDTKCGDEAKQMVIGLIYDEYVALHCDGVDKYGRELCTVSYNGADLGDILVASGYARYWR